MPSSKHASGNLEFTCDCGRDYGSIQLFTKKNHERGNQKQPTLSQRNDIGRKPTQPRAKMKPVEYSLFNTILSAYETMWLTEVSNSLEYSRKSLSHSEKEKLKDAIKNIGSHIKARIESEESDRVEEQEEKQGREYERWNVIETLDAECWAYDLMQRNDDCTVVNPKEDYDDVDETPIGKGKIIVRWNPIKAIRKYRRLGDPFRHLYFDMDFYTRAIGTHPKLMAYLHEHEEELGKAFDVINKYRNQFPNHNWRYTWYEWFWIARYAQEKGVSKAQHMLRELDGGLEGKVRQVLSGEQVRNQIGVTMNFWKDFESYTPNFWEFLYVTKRCIADDQELNLESKKESEQIEDENWGDITKLVKKHFDRMAQHTYTPNNNDDGSSSYRYGCKKCENFQNYYDDFMATSKGPDQATGYLSPNRNYRKEMEEYKSGSRDEKPMRKTVCYINPRKLSFSIRVKLHKAGVLLW